MNSPIPEHSINQSKIISKCRVLSFDAFVFFLLGFFSTMPILTFNFASRDVSFSRLLFVISLVVLALKSLRRGFIRIEPCIFKIDRWLGWSILSCLIGTVFFSIKGDTIFANAARSSIPKIIVLLLFAILWGNQKKEALFFANKCLIKGIVSGFVINLVWSICDAIIFYSRGVSINNIVFSSYLIRNGITDSRPSLILESGLLRSGGLNYDPAHLGYIVPVILGYGMYKKKPFLLVLALGGLLASASTTALVCSLIIFLTVIFDPDRGGLTKKSLLELLFIFVFLSVIILGFIDKVGYIIRKATVLFSDRVLNTYVDTNESNPRLIYLRFFLPAIYYLGPISIIGTGFGTASYGYALNEASRVKYYAFDMENTYICYLLDTGMIGIILFFICFRTLFLGFYRNSYTNDDNDRFILCSTISIAVVFLFYHYILFLPQMLVMISGLSLIDSKEACKHGFATHTKRDN